MDSNKIKKQKTKIIIIFLGALILLIAGITLSYFSSAQYVAQRVVKVMGKNMVEQVNNVNQNTGLEENFKTTSSVKMNLQSEYFQALSTLSPDYQVLSNLLRNLSNTETQITMIQDQQQKKLLINYDTKLSGESLANIKYLVDNAT